MALSWFACIVHIQCTLQNTRYSTRIFNPGRTRVYYAWFRSVCGVQSTWYLQLSTCPNLSDTVHTNRIGQLSLSRMQEEHDVTEQRYWSCFQQLPGSAAPAAPPALPPTQHCQRDTVSTPPTAETVPLVGKRWRMDAETPPLCF